MKKETSTRSVKIAQILATGSCPVCAALKHFQDTQLASPGTVETIHLCNHHAWALARSAPGSVAAGSFLRALQMTEEGTQLRQRSKCDFCRCIHEEETARIEELSEELNRPAILEWMQKYGAICTRHAPLLMKQVPAHLRKEIAGILQRTKASLNQELQTFLKQTNTGLHIGGGVLGRAAEFLTAQRGILD
jgi:hypothetical protein